MIRRTVNKFAVPSLQRYALGVMAFLMLFTFLATNLQALLWQNSEWLVSTILPAVVVDLTNVERDDVASPQLRRNSTLDAAARLKAQHMARNGYFSHFAPDGTSPWHWFKESGYVYAHAGENLAIHFTDSSEVVEAWMKSPTHKENIVNSDFTEIGVGTAKGEYDGFNTVYVVQLFGTPAVPSSQSELSPPPVPATLVSEIEEISREIETLTNAVADVAGVTETVTKASDNTVQQLDDEIIVVSGQTKENASVPDGPPFSEEYLVEQEIDPILDNSFPNHEIIPEKSFLQEEDVVVVTSPVISTSSGLAVANIYHEIQPRHAGATIASAATRPNIMLQTMYIILSLLSLGLIIVSVSHEARRHHFVQVTYGIILLIVMFGLWLTQAHLTDGALIV